MSFDSFLPLCREEALARGWDRCDFVYVTGDAYVDHPSFGAAIISRVLESRGFRVAILSQPDYRTADAFREYGRPRLGFLVSSGNVDSMVAHYTAAKKCRGNDYYTAGGAAGKRPDRAVIVYCNRIREAYGDIPLIIGGLEASLRRFAHYDYWDDRIRRSILVDSRADILSYGMGERSISRIAELLDRGVPVKKIHDVRGTVFMAQSGFTPLFDTVNGPDYDEIKNSPKVYASAFGVQYKEMDAIHGRAVTEGYGDRILVQNPPSLPLERDELDAVYALPFTRRPHPSYISQGGVPAIDEVAFSVTHNRGCYGGCNFCAITFHQGREVRSRSIESVISEIREITKMPGFKGYIHDIGGPTANFRYPSCEKQLKLGLCPDRKCLTPKPCPNLNTDQSEYANLLDEAAKVPGVKKVFVRSGIRYDYLIYDKSEILFKKLVRDCVSGQLKVAPEHCRPEVLKYMGKPDISVYDRFRQRFNSLCAEYGLEQYLVPYLISGHPGSTLTDAIELAVYLKNSGCRPEQVQQFYPTPGTVSTVMYYTGINPLSGERVYVARDYHEAKLQRALLQWNRRENAPLIREALIKAGRSDLIGHSPDSLVPPEAVPVRHQTASPAKQKINEKGKHIRHDRRK